MKICLVSQEYPDEIRGGIGSYTAGMAKALAGSGNEVHVLARSLDKPGTYRDGEVVIHKIAPGLLRHAWVRRYFGNLVHSVCVAIRLNRLIRDVGIQVVEVPEFAAEGFIYSLQPFRPAPLTVRLHTPLKIVDQVNNTQHSWGGRIYIGFLCWMERTGILRADAVTSPSFAMAEACRATLRLGKLPIHVFPNPVDTEYFTPGGERASGDALPPTILYTGQLGMRKGVDVFRDVIPEVLKTHPHAQFVFVGSDQGYNKNKTMREHILERLTEDQRQRALFLGLRPWHELRDLYRSAQVCVFPSRFENFPQVCLEAMACACAVVGSTSGGMAEIISDGVDGFLAEPGDAKTISARIRQCLDGDMAALRKAAKNRVAEYCRLPVVADHALAVFKQTVPQATN